MGCPGWCGKFFAALEFIVGVLIVVLGVIQFFDLGGDTLRGVIIGIYLIIYGTVILLIALMPMPFFNKHIPFYTDTFWGKGFWFIFMGFLCLGRDDLRLTLGIIAIGLGVVYMIANWVPGLPKAEPLCGGGCGASAATAPSK